MYNPNKAFPNFLADKFADEVFENNGKDPFHLRMMNIRSYRDLREYYGLGSRECDESLLREGFMSQKLHDCLEQKLGAERLAKYFGDGSTPKKTKEQQEEDDLLTMMFGNVSDYSRLRLHRLGKGNI